MFAVDDTVLLHSIDAAPPTPFVLNDSMGDGNYASVFDKAITTGTKTLVVVAAGNRGVPIDGGNPSYPAMSGARGVPNLIVVGALDRNGNPARFSNISADHVDLFAPGCAIPTELPDGSKPYLNGTSFAAPLVAFTGALIRALDSSLSTPGLAKRRIYATADYNPLLAGKSISDSQLNIIRAVYLYDDILTTAAGDIPGEWQYQPSMEPCIDSKAFYSDKLLAIKILPTEAQANPRARILFKVGNEAFDARECQLKPDAAITFKGPDGQTKDYLLGGIKALVPRATFLPK